MNNGLRDSSVTFITVVFAAVFGLACFTLEATPTITSYSLPACVQYDMTRGENITSAWDEHMMEYPERVQPQVVLLLRETSKERGLESDLRELAGSVANEMKNQGKYKGAVEIFQELLNTQKALGKSGISLVDTYNDLADTYTAAKDFAHAEEALQTALKLTEEFGPPDLPTKVTVKVETQSSDNYEVARCLDRLADLQKIQKNYQKELELRERAHNIRVSIYGKNSYFLVESYYNLADLAFRLGDKTKAVTLYVEGLKIVDRNHPAGSQARQLRQQIRDLCQETTKNPETPKK
ncbi:MAG: tetratricopeptide repeat protein [Candidatus Obscuribacterales bacterium]|nr:tetratricopeptide repeat protein [Candidatus Obscuribacterales bacterium]